MDSHIALWWDSDLRRLSEAQRVAIGDRENEVFVSAASEWELSIKKASGKLILVDSLQTLCRRFGFIELPITLNHGQRAAALPMIHKDPFDRMLVAQAIAEDLVFATVDGRVAEYGIQLLL
ncbi:PIN domain nuclease, a component of toxin-antitoxin system (PIN domain) [Granulicella rosea]|uniref:PIN domain nuclease, a component of toxin-antitoxin system (PIN domain) n=1 Tax=Granulicella rosea TaxID=474952 RepID=A0A239IHV9_9BACT|nr:PIN domain nuclease, a component of toxin-antitoxin system (PIN domain) [Granulicella rosea]